LNSNLFFVNSLNVQIFHRCVNNYCNSAFLCQATKWSHFYVTVSCWLFENFISYWNCFLVSCSWFEVNYWLIGLYGLYFQFIASGQHYNTAVRHTFAMCACHVISFNYGNLSTRQKLQYHWLMLLTLQTNWSRDVNKWYVYYAKFEMRMCKLTNFQYKIVQKRS
jgi:hypothetical protein